MIYIKKLKRKKIIEICLWLGIIVVTYFLWNFDDYYDTAEFYENNSLIEVLDDPTYSTVLYALNDQKADSLKDYHLTLVNNTYREEKYNLYLAISKNINHNHIKIKSDKLVYLNTLASYEDEYYTYYLLDTNMLQDNVKDYNFSLYNDESGETLIPYDLKIKLEKI